MRGRMILVVALILVLLQTAGLLWAYGIGVFFANPSHSYSFKTGEDAYAFAVSFKPFRNTIKVEKGWDGKDLTIDINKLYAAWTPVYIIGDCFTDTLYLSTAQKGAYSDVSGACKFVSPDEGDFIDSIRTIQTGRYVFMKMTYDYNFLSNGEVNIDANPENINYWLKQ